MARARRFPTTRRALRNLMLPWRLLRRAIHVLLLLPALGVVGVAGALWLSAPARVIGTPLIPGLSAPVEIVFDQDDIPRIRARNLRDAAAALGWLHANERGFQMEAMRRSVAGRLAEVAGPRALPLDRTMRVLGLRRRAEADWAVMPPETRDVLQAYADGVNAWFAAPELLAMGKPEPWTPVDSLSWGKLMSLWLSTNWNTERAREGALDHVDAARLLQFWPDPGGADRPDAPLTSAADAAASRSLDAIIPRFPAPFTQPNEESDAWAVDGAHSETAAPLLAGDPHLGFGFPAIWYLVRIDTPEGVLAGASAPGVPFLVLGHNGHVAWSFTTTGADTEDLFVEHVLPDGSYDTPDGPARFTTRQETIAVRGGADVIIRVRESRHGPIVSDIDPNRPQDAPVLALASAALAEGDTAAAGLLALNRATNLAAAAAAAPLITSPVQNLMVADHDHIGLFVTGRVPLRRAGDGALPVAGGDGAHDWTGFATGGELPRYIDPPDGVLVNGNERVAPADFPVFLGQDWFGDWRARRIRALIAANPRQSVARFTAMQADITSAFARQILPALRALQHLDGLAGQAANLLDGWDGTMAEDAPQPLVFNAWTQRLYGLALAKSGIPPGAAPAWMELVAKLLGPESSANGGKLCGGDCAPLAAQALREATAALAARFGPDPRAWRWGAAHRARFAHPLLGAFNLGAFELPVPGDDATLFRAGGPPDGAFAARHGAEFRAVYDLADLDRSRFVIAPGQSGNILSPHAHDFLARWHDGATIALDPYPATIASHIRLDPR